MYLLYNSKEKNSFLAAASKLAGNSREFSIVPKTIINISTILFSDKGILLT